MKTIIYTIVYFCLSTLLSKLNAQTSVALIDDQGIEFGYQYANTEGNSSCSGVFYKFRSYIKNKTNKDFQQSSSLGNNTIIYKILAESPGSKGDISYNSCNEVRSWGSHNRWNWTSSPFYIPKNSTVYSMWETYSIKSGISNLNVINYSFATGTFVE